MPRTVGDENLRDAIEAVKSAQSSVSDARVDDDLSKELQKALVTLEEVEKTLEMVDSTAAVRNLNSKRESD